MKIKYFPTLTRLHCCTLALLLLTGCNQLKTENPKLPTIPARLLKEPSGLAFDGKNFYIADWTQTALLRIDNNNWRPINLGRHRPIQVAALGNASLLAQTDAGLLLHIEEVNGQWQYHEIKPNWLHRAGAPFCWDGIYLWFFEYPNLMAAVLLREGSLIELPQKTYSLADLVSAQETAIAITCDDKEQILFLKNDSSVTMLNNIFNIGLAQKLPWPYPHQEPLAATATEPGKLIILAQEKSPQTSYHLLRLAPWN